MSRRPSKRWFWVILTAVASIGFMPTPAQAAYIDPATTSYLIQVVSGLVITLSVAIGVFFRKAQLFFMTLGARLSALRIRLFTASGRQAWKAQKAREARLAAAAPKVAKGATRTMSKGDFLWKDTRKWWVRLGLAAAVSFSLSMVYILFTVLDLYASNAPQLPFSIADLLPVTLLLFFGLGAGITLVLFLIRGRLMDVAVSGVLWLALAGWLQTHFLNPDFGQFMGQVVRWQDYAKPTVVNLAVWALLLGLVIAARLISRKLWTALIIVVSVVLLAGSSVSLISTYTSSSTSLPKADSGYLSYDNAFSLSSTHNEITFLVDTFDSTLVDQILEQDPHFFDPLTGFTLFNQNMSRYSQTDPAVPAMLTGQDYLYTRPYEDYKTQAWLDATGMRSLKAAGYSINIFSDKYNAYGHDTGIGGLVDNFVGTATVTDTTLMTRGMLQLAWFVAVPMVAKPTFWMDTTEFLGVNRAPGGAPEPYQIYDAYFYAKLKEHGITIRGSQPQFNYIHFQGSHGVFTLGADGTPAPDGSDVITQTKGVFHIIYDYLDQMKHLGIYDNATIVIAGDHGFHEPVNVRTLEHPILAGLFAKPAGDSSMPLVQSAAPTSLYNYLPTMLQQAGLDPAPGVSFFDVPLVSTEPRTYYWLRPAYRDEKPFGDHYEVVGDARDWANWRLVERFRLITS